MCYWGCLRPNFAQGSQHPIAETASGIEVLLLDFGVNSIQFLVFCLASQPMCTVLDLCLLHNYFSIWGFLYCLPLGYLMLKGGYNIKG